MADRARLIQALQDADAAGDVEAAQAFADAIRQSEAMPQRKPGYLPAGSRDDSEAVIRPKIPALDRLASFGKGVAAFPVMAAQGKLGGDKAVIPQIARSLWEGVEAPGKAARGELSLEQMKQEAPKTAGVAITGGLAVPRAILPAGSKAMNEVGPPLRAATERAAASAPGRALQTLADPLMAQAGIDLDGVVGRTMLRRIRDANPGMSDDEAIMATELQLKRLGSGAILADTAKPLQKLGRNMAQAPGETAQLSETVLNARRAGEKTAVLESIQKNISNRQFYKAADEAKAARAKSGPLFREAYEAFPNVSNDKLRLMIEQEPVIKDAMNRGLALERRAATDAGEEFKPETFGVITQFNEAGDPIITEMQKTPLQLWHATKRGLDAIISKRKNALGKLDESDPETGSLIGLRKSLDRELKTITGGEKGAYARANRVASDSYKLEEALDAGRSFARGDEEITDRVFRKYTPAEKDAYRAGVAREMTAMIRKNTSNLTPAQIMATVQDEAGIRQKLKIIAPSEKQFVDFMKDLESRLAFRETDRGTRSVSQTASILMEEGALAKDSVDAASRVGGVALDLGRGNVPGAITKTIQFAADQLRRLQMPQTARDRIGRLLYSQDPKDQQEALRLIRAQRANERPAGR